MLFQLKYNFKELFMLLCDPDNAIPAHEEARSALESLPPPGQDQHWVHHAFPWKEFTPGEQV